MFIYKITNKENGKCYVGQSINPVSDRWKRHCNDALNNVLDTHFARAIRLYGPDNFIVETIDTASNQEELTAKEHYWIQYYDCVANGYNETDAIFKSGGNTYQSKTPEEMAVIKQKLSDSKKGGKNPHSTKVKCKNVNTGEEYHFDSQSEIQEFFHESNHQFCSKRCLGTIKCLYKNEWLIAYEDKDYPSDYSLKGETKRKGAMISFTDEKNQKTYYFPSLREAERQLLEKGYKGFSRKKLSAILKEECPQIDSYKIKFFAN